MKKTLLAISLCAMSLTGLAQVDNGPLNTAVDFLSKGSNWIVAPYMIANTDSGNLGGGIGIGYKVSEYVVPTIRADYLDRQIWMPSGNLQLQLPISITKAVQLTPFVFTGIATPISGAAQNNGSAVGLFGTGAAIRFGQHFGLIGDYEKWTSFKGGQIRAGFYYKL